MFIPNPRVLQPSQPLLAKPQTAGKPSAMMSFLRWQSFPNTCPTKLLLFIELKETFPNQIWSVKIIIMKETKPQDLMESEVCSHLFDVMSPAIKSLPERLTFACLFSLVLPQLPGGSDGKESAHNVGDLGSTPGSGRSPGGQNGNPLQYPCLKNCMDRGAWHGIVHGVPKSWT